MKDQILKIAGVKSEKEFYKKYPSEEAFMKAHGKAFKKAAMGSQMVNDQLHQLTDFGNPPIAQFGGAVNPNTGMFNMPMLGKSVSQVDTMAAGYGSVAPPEGFGGGKAASGGFDAAGAGMAALGALPGIIGGIEAIGAQKKARQKNKQSNELGKLALEAQNTAQAPARKYVRPEDNLIQPGQMGNAYGSGTNFLAQNGTRIGGNPTEIQNMYNPGDMYTDLGFEPLGETLKQYRRGGNIPTAEFGDYFADSGEAQIGSAVGGAVAAGFGLPPELGQLGGKVLTNVLGIGKKGAREAEQLKQEGAMTNAQLTFGQNNQLGAFTKNGGWVSHDWQPQTITKFGEYNVKDLLKPPHDADMLRAGGHLSEYTPPSEAAMFTGRPDMPMAQDGVQMALGGELQVGEGGYAETLSYNPNLPGGEIGMFRGASHDNGGIQTQYGENGVEVEGGEPFTILENYDLQNGSNNLEEGGTNKSLTVFGNIKINKNIADLMGDPKAAGRKVKHYVADIAKDDAKQLKRINKATETINNSNNNSAAGHLEEITANLIKQGAEGYQKINAEKIKQAAIVQNAILDTASQLGVKSDKLAEGKIEKEYDPRMMAKFGKKIKKAQEGIQALKGLDDEALLDPEYPERMEALKEYYSLSNADREMMKRGMGKPGFMGVGASDLPEVTVTNSRNKSKRLPSDIEPLVRAGLPLYEPLAPQLFTGKMPNAEMAFQQPQPTSQGKGPRTPINLKGLGDIAQTALSYAAPFLRPSNANEALPPDQLYPEYFAMATNQLEPVQAQTFQPMLDTPMDISLNDQINAIDSQSRAAIRAAGSNPAAQAMIMSQALEAKNKVLGEQTRMNAANKMQTYDKNRAIVNDAKLKNLQILDQQYVRQAQAKSNTREQAFNALSSIAAKTAQQRAANRKLAVMENMYGFRFTPSGRAINVNAPAQFNLEGNAFAKNTGRGLASGLEYTYDSKGNIIGTRKAPASSKASMDELDDTFAKNGTKTSKKKARNSSIVKALKNL